MMSPALQTFLRQEASARFLRYVQINTASAEQSGNHPSSPGQWDLARLLKQELHDLQIQDVTLDAHCYLYATLPASAGVHAPPISLCAHLDTSPAESGAQVKPVVHRNYDGGVIRFPDQPALTLTPDEAPELRKFVGQDIITASGATLLGADDKAGIAEIMASLAALQAFPELRHPELRIVFTPDEEIGEGTTFIDPARLGRYGYTLDGGEMGELEAECFDAVRATLTFHGANVHPGAAKNRLINAAVSAARLIAALPAHDTPEHTAEREGFWHLTDMHGDENLAEASFILRDFEPTGNARRIELLKRLIAAAEWAVPGLTVEITLKEQYQNMRAILDQYPDVTHKAEQAMERAGIHVIKKAIRGGTDGARLSFQGMPTPNIFTGGVLYHSKKEWVPEIALQKAAEVIIHLCALWADEPAEER